MNQLRELMNLIIANNKDRCIKTCSELLENSEYVVLVRQYLAHLGFNISKMSFDEIAIVFFGIQDTLIIVKDDNYYFATLGASVVDTLRIEGRLLPKDEEDLSFDKTFKLIQGQTFESINKYLESGKFKLIRLTQEITCSHTNFICRASIMNPYPDLKGCKVYSLTELSVKFNHLVNTLVSGVLTINTVDGDVIGTCLPSFTDGKRLNYTCTSCNIYCKSLDRSLIEIPFWKVSNYSIYEPNEIIAHLLTGIYRVKKKSDEKSNGTLITMSREILRKFYGDRYLKLESLGVRQRYAYEDMLSIGFKPYDVSFFFKNYYFYSEAEMRGISNYNELREYLKNAVSKTNSSQYNGCVHPRILGSYSSILSGHAPFYMTLKNFDDYIFEKVNPDDVLPKLYYISGLTKNEGYKVVQVESSFESGAEELGKKEIIRQCGDVIKIVSVYCVKSNTYLKGKSVYSFGSDCQRKLLESLKLQGYSKGFGLYAPKIREICLSENITYNVSDDTIKYLFVNNLARKSSNVNSLSLPVMSECLVEFLDLFKQNKVDSALKEELSKIAKSKLKKVYIDISKMIDSGKSLDDIGRYVTLVPSEKSYLVQTQYGVLTIRVEKSDKLVLLQTATIKHNNIDLGSVRFTSPF